MSDRNVGEDDQTYRQIIARVLSCSACRPDTNCLLRFSRLRISVPLCNNNKQRMATNACLFNSSQQQKCLFIM